MTPLHLSAKWGLTNVTKVLLDAGASPSAVDNDVCPILFSPFLKIFNISFLDPDMKKIIFFVTNLVKINMFRFSLMQGPHRLLWIMM
jgi:hypothetical protein